MAKQAIILILGVFTFALSQPTFANKHPAQAAKVKTKTAKKWPEGITPGDVYHVVLKLNHSIDTLIKKKDIQSVQAVPKLKEKMSPMMVFQLHIASIEMLHDYELNLGLRPIPIVTSSPIDYYPADVKFLSTMILGQVQKVLTHFGIEHKHKEPKRQDYDTNDVFASLLHFYVKLAALNGITELTPNQTFSQMYRINMELKDIVLSKAHKISNIRERRLLAASTYGASPYGGKALAKVKGKKTAKDSFTACLKIRRLMKPLLDKYKIEQAPIPNYADKKTFDSLDVFVQTQIIIAEMGAWKRAIHNRDSTPITAQFKNKTPRDVFQEAQSVIYMLERIKTVMATQSS